MDVNGWAIIRELLCRRRKNQSDLARLLGISPAAITQIKQGDFQLGAAALEKIMRYLGATREEQNEIYTQVIQSRFFEKANTGIICQIIIIRRDERE
jgi:transcriptional regulator with XRE-family HTH domain